MEDHGIVVAGVAKSLELDKTLPIRLAVCPSCARTPRTGSGPTFFSGGHLAEDSGGSAPS